jgi:putative transposase
LKAAAVHGLLQRRACRLIGFNPKTILRPDIKDNPEIRARMRAIAAERLRFGYRRIGLIEGEGVTMNPKKLFRLYSEGKLTVRKRRGRKRATGSRAPMPVPDRPNARWSVDFVSDTFAPSRRFRIFSVVDDSTRESIGLIADTSISGHRVARELDAMIRACGKPDCTISDHGTEFTSRARLEWQNRSGVALRYIAPGQAAAERLR